MARPLGRGYKEIVRKLKNALHLLGVDTTAMVKNIRGLSPFLRNRSELRRQMASKEAMGDPLDFPLGKIYPCLKDRFDPGGQPVGTYFHMDLWAAQQLFRARPERHVDVGSSVRGFCAHVASFMEIEIFDIRPTRSSAANMSFRTADLMQLDESLVESTPSLSCLHALEHFGLGRYGDPVEYDGWRKGWDNLVRMVQPGGRFYFAVPIGARQRIEFDAHRVFSLPFIVNEMVGEAMSIEAFAYIDDDDEIHPDVDPRGEAAKDTFGLKWGAGLFVFQKHAV
ncbi:MAG: DUF268 domain-containing protein [Planctomycetota bacterium]